MNKVDYSPLSKRCPICGAHPVIKVSRGATVLGCFIKDMREVKICCPDCNSAHCATYVCYEDGILDSENKVLKEWSKWVDEQSIHYGKFDPYLTMRCWTGFNYWKRPEERVETPEQKLCMELVELIDWFCTFTKSDEKDVNSFCQTIDTIIYFLNHEKDMMARQKATSPDVFYALGSMTAFISLKLGTGCGKSLDLVTIITKAMNTLVRYGNAKKEEIPNNRKRLCFEDIYPYLGLLRCGYEVESETPAFIGFIKTANPNTRIYVLKELKTVSKYFFGEGYKIETVPLTKEEEQAVADYFRELTIAGLKGNHEERKEFKKYDPQMMDGLIKLRDWLMEDLNFFLKSRHSTKERNEYGDLVERFCYSINTSLSILKEREVFKEKYELVYPPLLYNILNELRRYVNSPEIEKKLLDDKDFSMKYADCWIADILYFLKDRETK